MCTVSRDFPTINRYMILCTIVFRYALTRACPPQWDIHQPPQCGPQRRETAVVDRCNGFHDHCPHYHDCLLNVLHSHSLPEDITTHTKVCYPWHQHVFITIHCWQWLFVVLNAFLRHWGKATALKLEKKASVKQEYPAAYGVLVSHNLCDKVITYVRDMKIIVRR